MGKNRRIEKTMLFGCIVLSLLSAAGIVTGTFTDLDTARELYSPDSVFWRIFTVAGMYPFMALWVLYIGVICRQVRSSDMPDRRKTVWTIVCGYLGLSTSVVCSWAMFAVDTIGGIIPQVVNNPPVIAAGALFGVYPLFFIGLFTSKKGYDRRLLKRLIKLCVIMIAVLALMGTLKLCFSRPRYRLLIRDIPGTEFYPWYLPFTGSNELISAYGLDWNDFRSFPSGHTLMCMSLIFVLPPLADVYGLRNGSRLALFAAGAVFAVFVGISRMVMGAHFLSDISMGALLAVVFAFIEYRFSGSERTVRKTT